MGYLKQVRAQTVYSPLRWQKYCDAARIRLLSGCGTGWEADGRAGEAPMAVGQGASLFLVALFVSGEI